jgi:hypothetical protein
MANTFEIQLNNTYVRHVLIIFNKVDVSLLSFLVIFRSIFNILKKSNFLINVIGESI